MNQEEWLVRRKHGIGGSEVAAIMGISPFKTPLSIWLDKTSGAPEEQLKTVRIRMGHALENEAALMYTEETGRKVRRCNILLQSGEEGDYRIGNVDRLCYCDDGSIPVVRAKGGASIVRTERALEIKTSGDLAEWDDVPDYYKTQVQHYMGLMPTVMQMDVPVIFTARGTFRIYKVVRNEDDIAAMKDLVNDFWRRYVLTNTPPPPINEDDCKTLWKKSNPGKKVLADAEMEQLIETLRNTQADIHKLEELEKSAREKIICAFGDAETMVSVSGNILASYKNNKDSVKTDWKAVAEAMSPSEELVASHTQTKEGARVFRLSSAKK